MSCAMSLLKATLALINTTLSVLGLALIALSLYELNTSTPGTIEHIAVVVQIFVGSFVILSSFLGCFHSCRESLSLSWSYGICLIILLAFQIYIIVVAYSTDYVKNATNEFYAAWSNNSIDAPQMSKMEQEYNCCGKIGYRDYIHQGRAIPKDCYLNFDRIPEHLFTEGCLNQLHRDAIKRRTTGLMIKWILLFIELLAIMFTGFMAITIRNKVRRQRF